MILRQSVGDPSQLIGLRYRVLIGVIGPPGAGKSTVIASLGKDFAASVFRLSDVVRSDREAARRSADSLGWVPDDVVGGAVRTGLSRMPGDSGGLTFLDNFPGTAAQLDILVDHAIRTQQRVVVLQLRLDADRAGVRVAGRRVCPACAPHDHYPATVAPAAPGRCASCGQHLVRRESDSEVRHGLRMARFQANIDALTAQALRRRVPLAMISATYTPDEVVRIGRDAVRSLIVTAQCTAHRSKESCHDRVAS